MERNKARDYSELYTDNSKCLRVSKEIYRMISTISKDEGVPMSMVTNELLATALENFRTC